MMPNGPSPPTIGSFISCIKTTKHAKAHLGRGQLRVINLVAACERFRTCANAGSVGTEKMAFHSVTKINGNAPKTLTPVRKFSVDLAQQDTFSPHAHVVLKLHAKLASPSPPISQHSPNNYPTKQYVNTPHLWRTTVASISDYTINNLMATKHTSCYGECHLDFRLLCRWS